MVNYGSAGHNQYSYNPVQTRSYPNSYENPNVGASTYNRPGSPLNNDQIRKFTTQPTFGGAGTGGTYGTQNTQEEAPTKSPRSRYLQNLQKERPSGSELANETPKQS